MTTKREFKLPTLVGLFGLHLIMLNKIEELCMAVLEDPTKTDAEVEKTADHAEKAFDILKDIVAVPEGTPPDQLNAMWGALMIQMRELEGNKLQ